jgi:soluble lytic murein transglycosylase
MILSLIQVESAFRSKVVSYAGAVGLMQIMPPTARVISKRYKIPYRGPKDLRNPYVNLTLGVTYLAELRDRYSGMSPYYHFAAYNVGPYRLDQLLLRKNFKPDKTKVYYDKIRNGVPGWRYYQRAESPKVIRKSRNV